MKKALMLCLLVILCSHIKAQLRYTNPNAIVDTFKKSIPCITKATIKSAEVEVNYYSPGVKNRTIWGGLVPYGEVWVTGAHNATSFRTNQSIRIGNTKVDAGKYAIFTIPTKDEWIFILNKNYQQHLADNYKQEEDVLRLTVKPVWSTTPIERLQYSFTNNKLIIAWEKWSIEIPILVQ